MTSELQRWARAELDLTEARPATSVAEMRPDEIRDWADAQYVGAPQPRVCSVRLEVVRVLREQSYAVVDVPRDRQPVWAEWDPQTSAVAKAILDTPVDQLADMVVMSDTVMGNWRTIAATVTQA
jgi:hypothetical protein